ncbi:MAG: protein phosphatase 2C domain-containing protein [Desulfobacterales bacterium]
MKIEHVLEKGSGSVNEDTLVIEKNLFGVFDGATSIDQAILGNSKTGGMIASSAACSVFSKNHYPLLDLARTANREIFNKMIIHGVDFTARERLWSTSAAVVRINEGGIEWVQAGDSYIIVIYKDNTYKVFTEKDDHDYETLTQWKLMAKYCSESIREALSDQIKKVRLEMNRSYGVLNGEKEAEQFFRSGVEPLDNIKKILLFTDGLHIPEKIPEKRKNFDRFVENYLSLGLMKLKDLVRKVENEDPDCKTYPRFKRHDDIAAISIIPS